MVLSVSSIIYCLSSFANVFYWVTDFCMVILNPGGRKKGRVGRERKILRNFIMCRQARGI